MASGITNENEGPLVGVKVVDLTHYQAGPICTMMLGDMGADVLKVEEPRAGDHGRDNDPSIEGLSAFFAAYNRNKKSATLNLKSEKGKELFRRLVQWADVLVENFRPGVMARLGFSYEDVSKLNPGIIMVSSSGFGQTGPYAQRAGFDTVAQAMSGLMSVTGFDDRPPARVGPAVADSTAGFFGVIGTILALYHKQRTGEGQFVDISLLEGQVALMGYTIMRQFMGFKVGRTGSQSTGASPAAAYPTSDGKYVYIFAQDSSHFPRLCQLMGQPELADDPRFHDRPGRTKNREEINDLVGQWTSTVTADALEAILGEAGLAYGRVNEVEDVMKDPQVQARDMLVQVEHHGKGTLPLVGVLPKLSKTPGSIRMPSPLLGQHNEEIYCGILDVSKEEFATLKSEGVI
tara:strand:+ start:926 stop:2137 length:1212 start_codon:yes stop_codon:yes gene_type:complete